MVYSTGNPFNCNCNLQKFIGWINENPFIETDTDLCLQPGENRTQEVKKCPDMCSCRCADREDDRLMFVDCSSRNLSVIPQFFRNEIPQMEVSIINVCLSLSWKKNIINFVTSSLR